MAKRKRDPISDYVDWTKNRYSPGHYLGGNAPPHLHRLSSPGLGKAMLLNAVLVAGLALVLVGWARGNSEAMLSGLAVVLGRIAFALSRRRRG